MWTGYKILIFSYLTTEIWMEKQYLSQREVDLEAYFTRNHTVLQGTRFKRAIFQGQYCRNFGCCEDRDDGCVTEFYAANALCYCDKFCDRENSDCCPDYKSFCREEKEWPPHTQPWYPEGRLWECISTLSSFITTRSDKRFFLFFLLSMKWKWLLRLRKYISLDC